MTVTTAAASEHDGPPGDLAIWFIILVELATFGAFFVSYAFARVRHTELFNTHQQYLSAYTGLVNTLVLITSSYFVVRAVIAVRGDRARQCSRWLWAAVALGGVFVVVKLFEFGTHLGAGVTLSTNSFYMFYLSLTFFHFMHVLLGMVILGVIAVKAGRSGYGAGEHAGVETGASYWHMVDLAWIILFSLVYVMR